MSSVRLKILDGIANSELFCEVLKAVFHKVKVPGKLCVVCVCFKNLC